MIQTSLEMMSKMLLQLRQKQNQVSQQISKLQTWPAKSLGWTLVIQPTGLEQPRHRVEILPFK